MVLAYLLLIEAGKCSFYRSYRPPVKPQPCRQPPAAAACTTAAPPVSPPTTACGRKDAIAALDKHDVPVGAVAHAYADDPEMRLLAARALAPIFPSLRARIITTLARRPLSDTVTTALLEKFDAERHGDVKVLAASGWAKRIGHDQQATTRAAERLTSLIQATGPAHEERRRAAFAALLVLGRAEVFADLRERYGNAGPVRVSPDLLHRDLEFVRLVAEHWSTLKELLGDQLPARLSVSGIPSPSGQPSAPLRRHTQISSPTCYGPSTPPRRSLPASRASGSRPPPGPTRPSC